MIIAVTFIKVVGLLAAMTILYVISTTEDIPLVIIAALAWLCWTWASSPSWIKRLLSAMGFALIVCGWVEYGNMRFLMGHLQGSHTGRQGHRWIVSAADDFRYSLIATALGSLVMACTGLSSPAKPRQTGPVTDKVQEQARASQDGVWPPPPDVPS